MTMITSEIVLHNYNLFMEQAKKIPERNTLSFSVYYMVSQEAIRAVYEEIHNLRTAIKIEQDDWK